MSFPRAPLIIVLLLTLLLPLPTPFTQRDRIYYTNTNTPANRNIRYVYVINPFIGCVGHQKHRSPDPNTQIHGFRMCVYVVRIYSDYLLQDE